jgi:hypothetical protein
MSAGIVNTMVREVKLSRARYDLAKVGKRRRKLAERKPVLPLTREQRVRNYANGRGWTADFTPKQRRRLEKKENRALGRHNPYITKVDGAKAFTTVPGAQ